MGTDNNDFNRRDFMSWAGKIGFGTASVLYLSSCGGGDDKNVDAEGTDTTDKAGGFTGGGSDKLKVGVIGPFSGVGAFVGRIVN
ncbi:MAG: hypothetical protein Q8K63_03005, partial [Acidimicrobiales bacterium]|nr:hypothetical protein [Acidimicrobiales bacterium]